MGVTQLWQILAPVEQHLALSSLEGQTLAVDLSIWVCENQCVKQMQGVVTKPYLRNLFFRISHLTQLGVKLVFVIEGTAPELKWDTMIKRQQSRFPGRQGKQPQQRPAGKQTRRNFNAWLKECCELLEILGIPYIQSKGEAEALCALLNSAGLVDGCLTNDGDAFLYGATTVYRNFTMNTKDPHVEMYRLDDITTKLGIDRGGLVALGLLIGCDFVPKGVPGIGIANAVRLLQSLQGQDVLIRLQSWSTMSERDCVDQAEVLARRKAIQVPDFPQIKVIDEFLVAKDRCPSRLPQWKRPVPVKLQEFALIKLEWPVEYTMEKVLPLITLWDMQDLLHSKNPSVHQHLKPHRIVKSRVRQGEPCFEVEWIKPVTDTAHDGSYYVTIESQDLFTKCYPDVAQGFITQTAEQKKKPKAKKKKKKAVSPARAPPSLDNLSFQFEKFNLGNVTSHLQQSAKVLHPSFTEYDETALTTKAKQPRHLTLSPNSKKTINKGESSDSRKPAVFTSPVSQETVSKAARDTKEEAFVPLSQRVKLRMQNKHGSNKENEDQLERNVGKGLVSDQKISVVKGHGGDLSNMSSLLEDIQNLSLKEQENFRHKMKGKQTLSSKFLCDGSPHTVLTKHTPSSLSRKFSSVKDVQKMSSPTAEAICSPMTYMKHQGGLGDSFEIQKSPYYIENPWAASREKPDKNLPDISSPGFFARPDTKKETEPVDNRSAAEKLMEKIESGINLIGSGAGNVNHISSTEKMASRGSSNGENLTVDSLMSILHSSEKPSSAASQHSGNLKTSTPGNQSVAGLDSTSLSQFGDFQIQHSLLNSLCSSLVQALTPKGVTMTKDEYDKLVTTLNELDSEEDEDIDDTDINGSSVTDDVVCNIDFSELEKASSGFKNLNQKLLLRPIQIDDEDVMSKLSKSARKKLRRRERKREQELENLAQLQNNSRSKGKTKNSVERKPTKNDSVKLNNLDRRTSIENANNTNRKLDTSKKANGRGLCNLSRKNSAEKVQSDLQLSNKSDLNKTTLVDIQKHASPDDMNIIENQHELVVEKIKKKRKKKKVKKASPVIDISADESILDDKKVESCAEYLKKALVSNQRKILENKITKACPFMDFSADNTLLELEEISCKIAGEEVDSEVHSKLKQRKRLSKEKANMEYETSQTNALPIVPVLSINSMLSNDSDKTKSENSQDCDDGEQDMQEVDDKGVTNEVSERNSNTYILGNKSSELKHSEFDGAASFRVNLTEGNNDKLTTSLGTTEAENQSEILESDNAIELRNGNTEEYLENGNENYAGELGKMKEHYISQNGYGIDILAAKFTDGSTVEKQEYGNENCAVELESGIKTEPNESTDGHGSATCLDAVELQNGGLATYHISSNGALFENGDTVKHFDKVNRNESGLHRANVESDEDKKYDESPCEIENSTYYLGSRNAHRKSNCKQLGNENQTQCFSEGTFQKYNEKENLHIVHGCNEEMEDAVSSGTSNESVQKSENVDFDSEIDSETRNAIGANDHETFKTYHTKLDNVINRGGELLDKNSLCVFEEEKDPVSHDLLVLNIENDSDGDSECGRGVKEHYRDHGIPDNAERIFEIRNVNVSNTELYMSDDEKTGAGICNGNRAKSGDRSAMKSNNRINCKSIGQEEYDDLSSSADEMEVNTLRNDLHKHADESETELSIGKSRANKNALENDITKSDMVRSPACLADRLKLKLRKTSTRNVLDVFTNGK